MNGAQRIGAELVMLFRREADAIEELKRVRSMIGNMLRDVREMPPDALYVHTGEMPAVTPEVDPRTLPCLNFFGSPVSWAHPSCAVREHEDPHIVLPEGTATPEVDLAERFEERRIVPMRPDHPDGGSTFALNPLMTAVTEQLPAPVSCPRHSGQDCPELHPHLHLADGSVTRIRDL